MWAIFMVITRVLPSQPCQDKAGPVGVVNGLELGKIETGRHGEETCRKMRRGDPDRRGAVDATGVGCTPRGVQRKGAMIPAYPRRGRGEASAIAWNTPGAWRSADRGAPLPMGQACAPETPLGTLFSPFDTDEQIPHAGECCEPSTAMNP